MCPVVAAASVLRVLACRGFTSAAVKRSQVTLEHPALPGTLGAGTGREVPNPHHAKNSSHTDAAAPASTQYTANGSRLFVRK
jgi:hypothetical protein